MGRDRWGLFFMMNYKKPIYIIWSFRPRYYIIFHRLNHLGTHVDKIFKFKIICCHIPNSSCIILTPS